MNIAFVDGQNLYLGISTDNWEIDLKRFRVYLRDKYKIETAYYYLGAVMDKHQQLYFEIQKAGFILVFREHSPVMIGHKKGNVDTDIVFEIMRHYVDEPGSGNFVLVSGDGDYKKIVEYLISKNRFLKILFPNKKFSSLYKTLTVKYFDVLSSDFIRSKIEKMKKRT